ncbi:hypothetical protein C0Q70_13285 [Pomacea canaliculata]|uniref:Lipoyl-binding domain-containing protein n=1 Tax=Pomacea canaliculata TaxID=400727 RepID=A0A2T7NWT5_POMCA|nr:hypothetical protein C0Q70_13285 [Pomacea canaliculata]
MVIATTGMRGLLGEAGCRSAEEKATSPDSIHCHRQSFDQVVKNVEEEISSGSGRACALLLRCHGTLAARFRGDTVANVFQQHRGFRCSAIACDEFKIVPVPTLAESISEGDVKWLVGVGDFVKTDQTVAEVETDKINVSVNTPAAGVIVELFVPDGEKVKTGEKLFKLKVSDAPPSKEEAAPSRPSPPQPPPPPSAKPAAPSVSTSHPAPSAPPPVPPVPSSRKPPFPRHQ